MGITTYIISRWLFPVMSTWLSSLLRVTLRMCHAYAQTGDSILTPATLMSHSHTLSLSCRAWHIYFAHNKKYRTRSWGQWDLKTRASWDSTAEYFLRVSKTVSWQRAMLGQKQWYLTWLFNYNRSNVYCLLSLSITKLFYMVHFCSYKLPQGLLNKEAKN